MSREQLPPRVRAEVQRILDRAARRLLDEQIAHDGRRNDGGRPEGRPHALQPPSTRRRKEVSGM